MHHSFRGRADLVGRPMEILLIEDDRVAATVTIKALKRNGLPHRLTWLTDGDDAVDYLFQLGRFVNAPRPDLILLDLTLPGMDGRRLLCEIRMSDVLDRIPIVVITCSGATEDTGQADAFNVEAYMTKPIHLEKFDCLMDELRHCWKADMLLPEVVGL